MTPEEILKDMGLMNNKLHSSSGTVSVIDAMERYAASQLSEANKEIERLKKDFNESVTVAMSNRKEIERMKADSERVMTQVLKVREELVKGDVSEAYHQLYLIGFPY